MKKFKGMRKNVKISNNKKRILIINSFLLLFLMFGLGYSSLFASLIVDGSLVIGKVKVYTVTFDANEGIVSETTRQVKMNKSIGTLPEPERDNYDFVGWYTDNTTYNEQVTDSYIANRDITLYARWMQNAVTVSFNTDDGSVVAPQIIEAGTKAIRPEQDPTKEWYIFDNWYADSNYTTVFDFENTTINSDTVIYAKFDLDPFPKVFDEPGECTFNGFEGYLSGDTCVHADGFRKYIRTGVSLYNAENHDKDYEIGLTIVNYDPEPQYRQATFINTKNEDGSNYPGVVFRRYDTHPTFDLSSRTTATENTRIIIDEVETIKIYRIKNKETGIQEIFYSVDGGEKIKLNDLSEYNPEFDMDVWFGCAPANEEGDRQTRILKDVTLSNMYIRLGTYTETES